MKDLIVVGGGLFGSCVAHLAHSRGASVQLFDDARPLSASAAAGCLMKPSWLSKMTKREVADAFELISDLFGITELAFKVGPATVPAFWTDPRRVMDFPRTAESVVEAAPGRVRTASGEHEARLVLVAAGVWTGALIGGIQVTAKAGLSCRLAAPPGANEIRVWAPYKQLVKFSTGDFHWAGDGSAINHSAWTPDRAAASMKRIQSFAATPVASTTTGLRPFAATHRPALLTEVQPGLWALTGGAKIGMAAAAWAAREFMDRVS
jgi:glycine/D-amino acid oxidase-like deaminating enzyme